MEFHAVHQKKNSCGILFDSGLKLSLDPIAFCSEMPIGASTTSASGGRLIGSLTCCTVPKKKKRQMWSPLDSAVYTNYLVPTTRATLHPTSSSRPLVRSPLPVDSPPLLLRAGASTAHSSLHLHADVVLPRSPPLSSEAHPAHLV